MKEINNYIDVFLISEYSSKFGLDIDNLPDHEVSNFLNILMQNDTHVRDVVRSAMQDLINIRLEEAESSNRYDRGTRAVTLSNGDYRYDYEKNLDRGAA